MKLVFDYRKLQGRIKEVFGSQSAFADAMGISVSGLSQRLGNKTHFSQSEIFRAVNLLGLTNADEYFFCAVSSSSKTKTF